MAPHVVKQVLKKKVEGLVKKFSSIIIKRKIGEIELESEQAPQAVRQFINTNMQKMSEMKGKVERDELSIRDLMETLSDLRCST